MFKNSVILLGVFIFSLGSFADMTAQNVVDDEDELAVEKNSEYFTADNTGIATALAAVIATTTYFVWKKYSGRSQAISSNEQSTLPVTPPLADRSVSGLFTFDASHEGYSQATISPELAGWRQMFFSAVEESPSLYSDLGIDFSLECSN